VEAAVPPVQPTTAATRTTATTEWKRVRYVFDAYPLRSRAETSRGSRPRVLGYAGHVLVTIFLTCVVALGFATLALLVLGHRSRFASMPVGLLVAIVWAIGAGELAARWWHLPSTYVEVGQVVLALLIVVVVIARPLWNPIGQVFFGSYIA